MFILISKSKEKVEEKKRKGFVTIFLFNLSFI